MRRGAGLVAVVAVALLAGCFRQGGIPEAAAPAPASTTTVPLAVETTGATVEPPVAVARPALCDGPQPRRTVSFVFNRDAARRDAMLRFVPALGGGQYSGGLASFLDLDAPVLAQLITAKFVDPYERQNAAPEVWEIFRFLCRHPDVRAAGYTISPDRPDYRLSIESIYAAEVDGKLRKDAEKFCAEADGTEFTDHLECFWD